MDEDLRRELKAAYQPAWELAMGLGAIRASVFATDEFGSDFAVAKLTRGYEFLVLRLKAASERTTDAVLDALDEANSYPVVIGSESSFSAFELALHEAHSEALEYVTAASLQVGEEVPLGWERSVEWPVLSEDATLTAVERLSGGRFLRDRVPGPLVALHVYKEFRRALGPGSGLKPPARETPAMTDIKTVLASGPASSTREVLDRLSKGQFLHGESTVKTALAEMRRSGELVPTSGTRGYAIKESV